MRERKTLQSIAENTIKEHYTCPQLPLAVYREVVAHLRQLEGVNAGLIVKPFKDSQESFDYFASQISALWLEYPQDKSAETQSKVRAILNYYGNRYRAWETFEP